MSEQLKYKRVLLKFSGEALMGNQSFGIDSSVLGQVACDVKTLVDMGVEVGIVVGGGNLFRGVALAESGIHRVTGDHMGMLATAMNGLAIQDALAKLELDARVMSGFEIGVCDAFDFRKADAHLKSGGVCIFVAGTGSPFFTTDTAATLRGIEIGADVVLKATKVDGIYSDDPVKNPDAVRFETVTYDEVIEKKLKVMDTTAFVMCQENSMPIRVFDMTQPDVLKRIVLGENEGTLVC